MKIKNSYRINNDKFKFLKRLFGYEGAHAFTSEINRLGKRNKLRFNCVK
jgi:hypothetical protein